MIALDAGSLFKGNNETAAKADQPRYAIRLQMHGSTNRQPIERQSGWDQQVGNIHPLCFSQRPFSMPHRVSLDAIKSYSRQTSGLMNGLVLGATISRSLVSLFQKGIGCEEERDGLNYRSIYLLQT